MKEVAKRGRPPKNIDKVRGNVIKLRLTKEELDEIQLISIFMDESKSEVIRKAVNERYYDLFGG